MVCVCAIGARPPRAAGVRNGFLWLCAAATLAGAGSASASDPTYNSQLRRVTATVQGGRPNTTQTLTAPDFSSWNATAVAQRSVNGNPNNVAQASQVSSLESDFMSLYGTILLDDNNPTDGAMLLGLTSMQVSFSIHAAQPFVLYGTTASSQQDRSNFQIRLAGPSGFLVLQDTADGFGDYLYRGTLVPGSYLLTAMLEQGMIDPPGTGSSAAGITAILTVPSPSTAAVLACIGFVARRRR